MHADYYDPSSQGNGEIHVFIEAISLGFGGFTLMVIRVMAKRFGLDPEGVLSNITTIYMMNEEHMVGCRDMLSALCTDNVGLLVVDSLGKLFKMELVELAWCSSPSSYKTCRYYSIWI